MALISGLADLHTHTTASDGLLPPAEVIRLAKEAGLTAVAVTDHDTVAGVAEAVLEGEKLGIVVVPGVEISTEAGGIDIHVLGYYTDNGNETWLERLAGQRNIRNRRNEMIVDRLKELGIDITMNDVAAAARSTAASKEGDQRKDASIGRPHIAEALIRKGAVADMKEAFDRYLASGAAAYVNPPRLHPAEAIRWIREAGGTSVIAHPGLYGNDELVEELLRSGAQGIEVYHSDHGEEEVKRYAALAERYGSIVTGGSDFHGVRGGKPFHGAVGSRTVDADTARKLYSAKGLSTS
ncbi:PHP domain-containing protein [Paenibacillus sp. N4]|uniref:PHP domain-containing protein n=1 Tax=Paenibacillus vietnamensis TaxID=2590547 RepID=UPI001CD04B9C|nr:PHP domain-containing protein [Paenibacillus vietnamensis]MCA0753929.1 PHP domain-containing protein [Paenibacillus vietnamensis]